jgi:hypothetical protein
MADKIFWARIKLAGRLTSYEFKLCGTSGEILIFDYWARGFVPIALTSDQVARLKRIAEAS